MTRFQKILLAIISFFLVLSMAGIILYINKTELNSQENVLFNVLLAIFSSFLSLIISHYYFDSSRQSSIDDIKKEYQSNLTLYAQKAAEKVDNLSSELTKLSIYLQQEVEGEHNPEIALLIKEEKMRSAIHIIQTLKSVNDKSLSDWRGVVSEDAIEERNEIKVEQETEFQDLIDSYRELLKQPANMLTSRSSTASHREINDINKKIDKLATSIIGTPIKKKEIVAREQVARSCPACSREISYKQRPAAASLLKLSCEDCGAQLASSWDKVNGFTLASLDIKAKSKPEPQKTDAVPGEKVIEQVKKELPPQPWPKGIAKNIAAKLGLSNTQTGRAIEILMKRGAFKKQINGKVYEPQKAPEAANTQG